MDGMTKPFVPPSLIKWVPGIPGHSGVYSSNNWPPFTGGQNSILNWVSKCNPLKQKAKK